MAILDEIKNNFTILKQKGPVISVRPDAKKNDGAVGNTFEREMNVPENNLPGPDFKGWEFKTKRKLSDCAASLFTLKPDSQSDDEYMKENWGVSRTIKYDPVSEEYIEVKIDEGDGSFPPMNVLRTSIYNTKFTSYYEEKRVFRGFIDYEREVYMVKYFDENHNLLDDSVYWTFNSLKKKSEGKLKNTIFCMANEVTIDNKIHFEYTSAFVYSGFRFENLLKCLEKGTARYEHRLGRYKSGSKLGLKHNHGGGWRLNKPDNFKELFDNYYEL